MKILEQQFGPIVDWTEINKLMFGLDQMELLRVDNKVDVGLGEWLVLVRLHSLEGPDP